MKRSLQNPVLWVVLGATVFVAWVTAQVDHRLLGDDALITLTYAKNLARGDGFVFNHPPPVLGTTTPLYALLVAIAARLVPNLELTALAVWLSAACWAGLGWAILAFRRDLGLDDWQAAAVALLVAAGGWVHHIEMEAYLFAVLMVVAIGLFFRRRAIACGAVCGLLFLTRGEGVLLVAILLAWTLVEELRSGDTGRVGRPGSAAVRLCVGTAVPTLIWFGYAQLVFGNVFPNTLAAKIAQGESGLWRPFAEQLVGVWLPGWGRELGVGTVPFLNLWYLFAAGGLAVVVWRQRRLAVFVAWTVLYGIGYTVLGVPGYRWYGLPVYFTLSLLCGVGLGWTASRLATSSSRRDLRTVAAVLLVGLVAARLAQTTVRAAATPQGSERRQAYLELARWFSHHVDDSASIAYHEIGYLGFYTDNRIVDLAGLVLPDATANVSRRDFSSAFWDFRPDYFVRLEGSGFQAAIINDPRFSASYRPVFRRAGFEGRRLAVFERRDLE